MDRKEFLKTCGFACLGAGALSTVLSGCSTSSYYAVNTIVDKKIVIKKSEFIRIAKDGVQSPRKYVLVKSEKLAFPICVYKLGDNDYSALLMECTHKSCELTVSGSYLVCPCHGSEFSNKGLVQNPPAEAPLKSYATTQDENNVYIVF